MGVFENFPYTNFHDLNLDWILRILKQLQTELGELGAEVVELRDNIPDVVQTSGQSTSVVMSQKAATDAIATAKQEAIAEIPTVVQTSGQNTSSVMSQKAATDAIATAKQEAIAEIPALFGTTGQSTIAGMTQKAITDAIAGAVPPGSGVKSIELYREAASAISPAQTVSNKYINSSAVEVSDPDASYRIFTFPDGASGRVHIEAYSDGAQRPMIGFWERTTPDGPGLVRMYNSTAGEDPEKYVLDLDISTLPTTVKSITVNFWEGLPIVEQITDPGAWNFIGPLPDASVPNDALQRTVRAPGVEVITSAPTGPNGDGLKFAVLTVEPATKYSGWVYLITEV